MPARLLDGRRISEDVLACVAARVRARIAAGLRADLVELSEDLLVQRVMKAGTWVATA